MFMGLLFMGVLSVTGAADCAVIRDHDSRMICFARVSGQESYCGFVRNPDRRVECRMLVR
jgi:hypothetical protein